jgi:hypothetical protein
MWPDSTSLFPSPCFGVVETELFHRGYNPRTLPPEFTTWFDFVAAEGDATALEAECLGRHRDWFVMLATTRMTKSFKMVLLRVLLDNDAVFSGMPIPELVEVPDLDPPLSITARATIEATR